MSRPTPAQDHAVRIVGDIPGIRPWAVACSVGPNGSAQYGYRTLYRAVAAGRIVVLPDPARPDWGRCYLPEDVPVDAG